MLRRAAVDDSRRTDATSRNNSSGTTVIGGGRTKVISAPQVALLSSFNAAQPSSSVLVPAAPLCHQMQLKRRISTMIRPSMMIRTSTTIARIAADDLDKHNEESDEDSTTEDVRTKQAITVATNQTVHTTINWAGGRRMILGTLNNCFRGGTCCHQVQHHICIRINN